MAIILPPYGSVVETLSTTHGVHVGDLVTAGILLTTAAVGTAVLWGWRSTADSEEQDERPR
jgi:hypothetical protein